MESTDKDKNIKLELLKLLNELIDILEHCIKKDQKEKVERLVWRINKTSSDFENYYRDIKNDLNNIIQNVDFDSFKENDKKTLKIFASDLCKNIKEENEEDKIDESIIKLKLNILTNYMYSASNDDMHIIKYYKISNSNESDVYHTVLSEIITPFYTEIVKNILNFFKRLERNINERFCLGGPEEELELLENLKDMITNNLKSFDLYMTSYQNHQIVIENERVFLEHLSKFYSYIKHTMKDNDKRTIILSVTKHTEWEINMEKIEMYRNCTETLLDLMSEDTLKNMFFFREYVPSKNNLHDIIHSLKCMRRPQFISKDNYFQDVLKTDDELNNKKFNFKNYFRDIFSSNCVKSYYEEVENLEIFNEDYLNEISNPNTFDRFYERISYAPIPYFLNGLTDASLMIFINSNDRKSFFKRKFFLKFLFDAAALIVTLVHESNYFIRRFLNMGKKVADANTKENFYKKNPFEKYENKKKVQYEGGKIMSESIFGDDIVSKLNVFQVCFILDPENWKKDYNQFRRDFIDCDYNDDYVRKVLNQLKEKLDLKIIEEIEEICKDEQEFKEVCGQTVYCRYPEKGQNYHSIELGRCLIDLSRQENPNFII